MIIRCICAGSEDVAGLSFFQPNDKIKTTVWLARVSAGYCEAVIPCYTIAIQHNPSQPAVKPGNIVNVCQGTAEKQLQ